VAEDEEIVVVPNFSLPPVRARGEKLLSLYPFDGRGVRV